ncbi:MAG: hypothetical protein IT429_20100, partial [Gemmataceae bacterium]|nr:hypothetical protein [Gemmataceae bacterium]
DELAKAVARGTSRRKALKTFVVSVLGGLAVSAISKDTPTATAATPLAVPAVRPIVAINLSDPCINVVVINVNGFPVVNATNICDVYFPFGEDEKDEKPKPTGQQRHQKERSNKGSKEDERVEGNVVAIDLNGQPPTITIANRDGNVVVVLSGDALADARYIKVGDYVEASGEKQHELLFWASGLSKD